MKTVFLVMSEMGSVLAIFANKEDAEMFSSNLDCEANVVERTVFFCQPRNRFFNL